jgi:hypothetical protein
VNMPLMEPMSFWELIKNSPEWVGVFANALFAMVTISVVTWQVYVMKAQVRVMEWQGRTSARHELIQNRLIRLQHEHEWVIRKNIEREHLLKLGRQLHLAVGCLKQKPSDADGIHWGELQDTVFELSQRLRILDVGTYSGAYDQWFFTLEAYVEAVQNAVLENSKFNKTYDVANETPNLKTRETLAAADTTHKPISIFLDIEAAIRMEFFEFKKKWDSELPPPHRAGAQKQSEDLVS